MASPIFGKLGMNDTGYNPSDELKARAETIEKRDGKGEWIKGEVKAAIRLTTFHVISGNHHFFLRVIGANKSSIRFEYLLHFISDQIIDCLHIQF